MQHHPRINKRCSALARSRLAANLALGPLEGDIAPSVDLGSSGAGASETDLGVEDEGRVLATGGPEGGVRVLDVEGGVLWACDRVGGASVGGLAGKVVVGAGGGGDTSVEIDGADGAGGGDAVLVAAGVLEVYDEVAGGALLDDGGTVSDGGVEVGEAEGEEGFRVLEGGAGGDRLVVASAAGSGVLEGLDGEVDGSGGRGEEEDGEGLESDHFDCWVWVGCLWGEECEVG